MIKFFLVPVCFYLVLLFGLVFLLVVSWNFIVQETNNNIRTYKECIYNSKIPIRSFWGGFKCE